MAAPWGSMLAAATIGLGMAADVPAVGVDGPAYLPRSGAGRAGDQSVAEALHGLDDAGTGRVGFEPLAQLCDEIAKVLPRAAPPQGPLRLLAQTARMSSSWVHATGAQPLRSLWLTMNRTNWWGFGGSWISLRTLPCRRKIRA